MARHMIGEAVMAAHPEAELLPEGSDVVLHEKSGGGNPLFVRNIAIVSPRRMQGPVPLLPSPRHPAVGGVGVVVVGGGGGVAAVVE